jgi:AraC-like DNA-binding protein
MELNLIDIISLFIAFISVLFALFLLSIKSKNYLSNILIAIFLLTNAQDSAAQFVGYFIYPNYPGLGLLINTTLFLLMPTLYLYILSTIYSDFKLKKKDLWHLLPFFIVTIVFIPNYYSVDYDAKITFWEESNISTKWEVTFDYIFAHIQILVYVVLSYLAVYKYKRLLLENYSNASMFNYRWLFQLITIFAIESLVATFKNVFMFLDLEELFYYTLIFTSILELGFICWMVLKALQTPELFRGISSDMQLVKDLNANSIENNSNEERVKENSIKIKQLEMLDAFMIENKPFLDANLTLYDLSEQIDIPSKDLSLLINRDLNQHFFDFVNGYRIRMAMDILKDPSKKAFTVLEILYEVGFNSKSSFNTAFKKYSNLTPTEYRKKYLPS